MTRAGRVAAAAYVGVVTCLAWAGFAGDSTAPILLAGTLTLPASLPAAVGYYSAFGLLALAPGANPSTTTGGTTCSAAGECRTVSSGDAAAWFVATTDVLGVLALTAAAVANVLLVRAVASRRARTRSAA